jgi:23S rRNA (adenine2503-C2)-methyltransferase
MGVAKSLSPAEILDQIVIANERLKLEGMQARNIVFMGMGEPFHNEAAIYEAVSVLLSPESFHHPARYLLISTVGIPDAMVRCARRFPAVNLALSLHSVRQSVRERLIPLAAKHSLEELRATIVAVNAIQQKTVMIEYLMLAGVNDSAADAHDFAAWLAGLNVHVNLIPYNPIATAPDLRTTERPERDAFASTLRNAGYVTTIRYSLGADIAAACGQLVQSENRAVARQQALASA